MIKPILMMSALLLMTACLGITAGPGPQYHSWYCEIWKGLDKDARAAWIEHDLDHELFFRVDPDQREQFDVRCVKELYRETLKDKWTEACRDPSRTNDYLLGRMIEFSTWSVFQQCRAE